MIYLWLLATLTAEVTSDVVLPRGVSLAKASLYAVKETFTCLDGSDTIKYEYINDDYCDCDDGSDEPGTSACAAGLYYCPNKGHSAAEIPSSWVNDGVCDCCDGSDEYASGSCPNTCEELGAEAKRRQELMNEMRLKGYEVKLKLMQEGQQKLTESNSRLKELAREKEVAEEVKRQRDELKQAAEVRERELLDLWHEARRQEDEQREAASRQTAEDTFKRLDTNADGKLTHDELLQESRLDRNADGEVTKDEIDMFTLSKDEVEMEEFVVSTWPLMKPFFHHPAEYQEGQTPPDPTTDPDSTDPDLTDELLTGDTADDVTDTEDEGDEEEEEGYEGEDEDYVRHKFHRGGAGKPTEKPAEPEYDPDTQAAVDAAKQARDELSEAERQLRDIQKEVDDIESFTGMDLGPEQAFAALHHQCFVFNNPEYEYKLCVFDKASQKPRSGGIETSLGRWGRWLEPEQNDYTQQIYENGQQCWNGPKRSAHITLQCGEENRVVDVTEPAKCEYLFTFHTPAVCDKPQAAAEQHYHQEL